MFSFRLACASKLHYTAEAQLTFMPELHTFHGSLSPLESFLSNDTDEKTKSVEE